MEMQITKHKLKDEHQKKALNAWRSANYIGSVICGTGFGKSRVGVLAVANTLNSSDNQHRALVLVPTTQLQEQFKEEFKKWGKENLLDNIDILCYQSAYKLVDEHYSIVVCDEVHLGLSPEYRKFFENNTYDRLLCMTATLPEEDEYRAILVNLAPTVYSLTLDECVDLGLVAPYNIICRPISLDEEEQKQYKMYHNRFRHWSRLLGFDAFKAAQFIMANKATASTEDKKAATMFFNAIRARKSVVDRASSKIIGLQKIVVENLDTQILVFSNSNTFTDELCSAVSDRAVSYHSSKSAKQRKEALQRFNDGDADIICSTKALNQGFDVPHASVGVICGLTSKSLPMIQRVGRLLRYQKDKVGKVYILYVKDSQEEKWLNKAVIGLKNIHWEE